jgi:hypothetical protein
LCVSSIEVLQRNDRHFELKYRNRKILESRFPVKAVARFGDFLVFIEDGAWLSSIPEADRTKLGIEKGIQYLSFIDLKSQRLLRKQGVWKGLAGIRLSFRFPS